jgi:exo-1,4-beta-D-glucosaminidase
VNGTRIASARQVIGTFRTYAFDVTDDVHAGANGLAVRVYPVDPRHDLTLTWIDWSPMPPDNGMGIWHDVWLTRTGPVTVTDPQVTSVLPLPSTANADLTVSAQPLPTPTRCPSSRMSKGRSERSRSLAS